MTATADGLRDVVIGPSEICDVQKEGNLYYRGYNIHDLADHSTFEEVVYLLWYGALPARAELADFSADLARHRTLPAEVLAQLVTYPKSAISMDALRTAVSALGMYDPDTGSHSHEATLRKSARLQAMLPTLGKRGPRLPLVSPPVGVKRARVAVFTGCVADAMFPETNAATVRVLRHNGCEVVVPRDQVCCGAIHYHSGIEKPALDLARQNMKAFNVDEFDAVIVNAAGCGAMMKDYVHLLPEADHDAAHKFVAKVRDVSEFLDELGIVAPTHPQPLKVTYHDACHLCHAQQIRSEPRRLLQAIPGVELVPLEESELCCGAAGTYNLSQPEMSARLGRRKMANIAATGASVVATGNVGCILQIAKQVKETGSAMEVVHPIDLLDRAYGPLK